MEDESFKKAEATERTLGSEAAKGGTSIEAFGGSVEPRSISILERQAVRVAERPCTYFWVSLIISVILSVIGVVVGDFKVYVDGDGWLSRGTPIADRHSQFVLIHQNRKELFNDSTGNVWEDLITNIQPSWETDDDEVDDRRLSLSSPKTSGVASFSDILDSPQKFNLHALADVTRESRTSEESRLPVPLNSDIKRMLQRASQTDLLYGCNTSWYETEMISDTRLWPVWRPTSTRESKILLGEEALRDLCHSEEITQEALVDNDLCYGCSSSAKCLPPYSIVLFVRITVPDGADLSCEELAAAWVSFNAENQDFENELISCGHHLATNYRFGADPPDSCPPHFSPIMIDELYSSSGDLSFTSSVFATKSTESDIEALYEIEGDYSRGTGTIKGTYDTQDEDFVSLYAESALGRDLGLALGSAFITMLAILIHTGSPFLTAVGLLQIGLSFPLSYFVYTFLGKLDFFPFLNFIGIFVVFALGADDVFVAVDKWKNTRIEHGTTASVAEVAAVALPDAAGAMFLTTLTTAVAFFGTAICPVAPIRCFSIFCGLLIVVDYIMCVAFVFPALCIYDRRRHQKNCCCRCSKCQGTVEEVTQESELELKPSPIRRILTNYYHGLHIARYALLAICLVTFIVCTIFAAKMDLPTSSDVRILDESNEFEKNFLWRQNLLFDVLERKSGSSAFVIWGTTPADTGDRNNPDSFTQLVLDDSFDPSKPEAQVYLQDFCDNFFSNEWATPIEESEKCPINRFNDWLKEQSNSDSPEQIYLDYCGATNGLPLAESDFQPCLYLQLGGSKLARPTSLPVAEKWRLCTSNTVVVCGLTAHLMI